MALYVDDAIWRWQGLRWAHLLADDIDELHRFAIGLGIHRLSYQGPPRTSVPHYDLTAYERRRAIAGGAIACSRDEIVAVLRRSRSNYRLAQTWSRATSLNWDCCRSGRRWRGEPADRW